MVTIVYQDALDSLKITVASIVPSIVSPTTRILSILPLRINPAGIGGIVGLGTDIPGEIPGCQIDSRVTFIFESDTIEHLVAALSQTVMSLVSLSRVDMAKKGILRQSLYSQGDIIESSSSRFRQIVTFALLYEYIPTIVTPEGIITEIPQYIDLPQEPEVKAYSFAFETDPMAQFIVFDDPMATWQAPSRWVFNSSKNRIEQQKRIRGTVTAVNANKPGTVLLYNGINSIPLRPNYRFSVAMESADENGIGLVFNWLDSNNYCFVLLNSKLHYRMIGKKASGAFSFLETSALDTVNGCQQDTRFLLSLTVKKQNVLVFLDGTQILSGADPAIVIPGQCGLFSFGNNKSYFYTIEFVLSGGV